MKNLTIVENPLIKRDLTILRDKTTLEAQFRNALDRIGFGVAFKVSENIELNEIEVQTPLEKTAGYEFKKEIVLVPILRAGLSLVNSFLKLIPTAKVGHIGIQRNEQTLEPIDYYFKVPKDLKHSMTIILDPMLATGGSASAAIKFLKAKEASQIILATIIAAPEGVSRVSADHPDVKIFTASLDRELNEHGYIVPGLGDAGDRNYGTL